MNADTFSNLEIPITTTIAWNRELTFGKIYAPEFLEEDLEDILLHLKESGVVSVRKILSDPTKHHVPSFVLTFLGNCPSEIKV